MPRGFRLHSSYGVGAGARAGAGAGAGADANAGAGAKAGARHLSTEVADVVVNKTSATPLAGAVAGANASNVLKSPANAPRGALDAYELGEDEEVDDLEEMFIDGPAGVEWGGPTRGGQRPEPTRYGDWERKGRASDF
jgi:hypothetical protein